MAWRTTLGSVLAVALTVAGALAQTEVLFSETFTGPNRSQPSGWQNINTPQGSEWYLRSGEFTSGNGDNIIQQDKRTWAIAQAGLGEGWSDYEIVVDAHMNQRNGGFMLVGRWDEEGNHYAAVYETRNGVVHCRIERHFDRRADVLAEISSEQDPSLPNLANGQTRADGRTFRFVLQGDLLAFYIDRREILTARDDSLRRGTAGLGQFENFVFFDNFRVIGTSAARAIAATPQVGEVYRLRVADSLPRQEARAYQRYLEDSGFFPVILNENVQGQYEILTGTFLSEDEARRRGDFLLSEGELLGYELVETTGQVDIAQELERAAEARLAHSVRVLVTYDEEAARETERILIEDLGYFPVSVLQEGNRYAVLVGNFSDEQEATRLLPELLDEGFTEAVVVNTERDILIEATALADAQQTGQEVLSTLSQDEQREVEQFLERMRRAARGSSTFEEMQELQALIFELQSGYSGLREAVESIREQEREREERDQLVNRVTSAIDQENWNTAERELQLLAQRFPNDPFVGTLQARIDAARGAPAPTERPTGSRTDEAVNNYIATAQRQAEDGNLDLAIITIETALRELPSNARLQEHLASLRAARNAQRPQPAEPVPVQTSARGFGDGNTVIYAIGGAVALLIVGFLILWRRQSRLLAEARRAPVPAAAGAAPETMPDPLAGGGAETMPDPLAASGGGGIGLDPSQAEQDVAGLSAMVLGTMQSHVDTASDADTQPDMPAMDDEKIKLSLDESTSGDEDEGRVSLDFGLEDEEETSETEPADSGMVDLDFSTGEETPPEEPPQSEPKPVAEAPPEPEPKPMAEAPPAPEPEPEAPAPEEEELSPEPAGMEDPFADLEKPKDSEESEETVGLSLEEPSLQPVAAESPQAEEKKAPAEEPPLDDIMDDDITAPLTPAAGGESVQQAPAGDEIFAQRFSAAQEGHQPEEWVGDYDFASLTVVTDNTPDGTEAALKFEKQSGAGSAFYTCKFPEATGRVVIEFDLCCVEKNQYLLGLYFEHEENFRQSVHTVMHRAGETITLRLQGKSADYEFGKWVHIKYLIDLPTGLVDGSVDGKQVARNVPMLSMTGQQLPPSINTISIRDTLASEGVFLIANVRVTNA